MITAVVIIGVIVLLLALFTGGGEPDDGTGR